MEKSEYAYINRGVPPNAYVCLQEGEGVKNWQNLAYVVYGCPLKWKRDYLESDFENLIRVNNKGLMAEVALRIVNSIYPW